MIEIIGDLWKYHGAGCPIVITTNGDINSKEQCVMGRGVALEMKLRYPEFPRKLATHIKYHGNKIGYFMPYQVFTFPTKHHWYESSDIRLIEESAKHLALAVDWLGFEVVYMVRPGCSNGRLEWSQVKPVIQPYLNDRFVVVEKYAIP